MSKNIVICADGTGNSFARSKSNVARMIELLALDDHSRQVVVYDQGIGTDAQRWKEIEKFREEEEVRDCEALHVLRGPHEWPWLWTIQRRHTDEAINRGLHASP